MVTPPLVEHKARDRLTQAIAAGAWLAIGLFVAALYLRDLDKIPNGFFCDEAEIGLESQRLATDLLPRGQVPLFYNQLGCAVGALPLYSTAPLISLLGLNEVAVRLSSGLCMLASFVVLYWGLNRKVGAGNARLATLLFALTPAIIHIGRVNIGHAPSLLFMISGLTLFSTARDKNNLLLAGLAGLLIVVSAYGYLGYLVAAPLVIFCLCLSELIFNRRALARCRPALVLLVVAVIAYGPILNTALHEPAFWNRWAGKAPGDASAGAAITRMAQNYLKYYSPDYLFLSGEVPPPDVPITRDAVTGSGVLLAVTLPLLAAGLVSLPRKLRSQDGRTFAPFVLLLFLYPLPDLLTTRSGHPPYTFSVFTTLLFIPYIVAVGLDGVEDFVTSHIRTRALGRGAYHAAFMPLLTAAVMGSGVYFTLVTYRHYPLTASDMWGWQYGPRDMIGYFVLHAAEYDEFYIQRAFNSPEALLEFYIQDPAVRQKAHIGGLEKLDPGKKQLFGVSRATFDKLQIERRLLTRSVITYPDGSDAYYLVENDLEGLKSVYAPVKTADDALGYALAATPFRAYYAVFPTAPPFLGARTANFTDRFEPTHVTPIKGGYLVYLFDYYRTGCSPWRVSSVTVGVGQDGSIAVLSRTVLYQFELDDPSTPRLETGCIID
jgi:Dolichyl-phosphate-mannose-protein mannosyltransferase